MKSIKLATLVLLVIGFSFDSCKKGPDDPAFTLRTRKSRISGNWTMTLGNVGLTEYHPNQPALNSNFEFSGGNGTLTQTGTLIAYTLKYTLNLTFDKHGNFTVLENFNGISLNCSGTWNFSSGIGNTKNKEDVYIKLTDVTAGDTQNNLFNNFGTEICYQLKQLSSDKLVMYTSSKEYMNTSGDKEDFEAQYTFTKQ